MMSAFFHSQHTLVTLTLDKFFCKYEREVKLTPPPEKTTVKKPALLRLKQETL